MADKIFSFGEFEVDSAKRLLLKRGQTVHLKSKDFDLLLTLIEHHGEILSKNDLLDLVWENQFVEENNLTVHVAALRKALGETKDEHRFIVTVPGSGYKFVGDLTENNGDMASVKPHAFSSVVAEDKAQNGGFSPDAYKLKTALRKRPVLLATLLIMVLLGSSVGWIYNSRKRDSPSQKNDIPAAEHQLKTHVFTTDGGIPWRVVISRDGKWVAYVQRAKGLNSLWIGDLETNHNLQIIAPLERFYEYIAFSPDGKSLYFTTRDENHPQWTLMRVPIFGGATQELATGANSTITFSPDGKQIAFLREYEEADKNSLVIADAETGKNEQILLTREKSEKFASRGLAWSPNGKIIAVGAGRTEGDACDILAVNTLYGTIEKIGNDNWNKGFNLVWLKDGSGLVLINIQESNSYESLRTSLVSYPAGEARQLTNESIRYSHYSLSVSDDVKLALLSVNQTPQLWKADGENFKNERKILDGTRNRSEGENGLAVASDGRIFYSSKTGDKVKIWEMSTNGENQRQVTSNQTGADDFYLSITAKNRYLVFTSNPLDDYEIWRSNLDGTNITQLTKGGVNTQPSVSPDGNWVIYASTRDGKSTIWRVSIDGGEAQQLTTDETSWPSISPNGKFIACAYGKTIEAFDRRIALFSIAGGSPLKIFTAAKQSVLESSPRWSPDSRSIIYRDRMRGLWRQDMKHEGPERVKGFDDFRFYDLAFSPDGKNVIVAGFEETREIVIAENFR